MITCFSCGRELSIEGKVTRKDLCPHCKAPLRVCLNCRFYDKSAHNNCREPAAEWVRDKEKENFCDYFEPTSRAAGGQDEQDEAREALKKLFG